MTAAGEANQELLPPNKLDKPSPPCSWPLPRRQSCAGVPTSPLRRQTPATAPATTAGSPLQEQQKRGRMAVAHMSSTASTRPCCYATWRLFLSPSNHHMPTQCRPATLTRLLHAAQHADELGQGPGVARGGGVNAHLLQARQEGSHCMLSGLLCLMHLPLETAGMTHRRGQLDKGHAATGHTHLEFGIKHVNRPQMLLLLLCHRRPLPCPSCRRRSTRPRCDKHPPTAACLGT